MSFSAGDLFHIEMRNGIYQVLGLYGSDDKGNVCYFRKVFDGKLNLKVSKAETVHESWMTPISAKTQERLSEAVNSPEIREALNDLTIHRRMLFGTNMKIETPWCIMDPKNRKKLEKHLNNEGQGCINPFLLRNAILELHNQGELHIVNSLEYPSEGERLYRVELGRYCDDFDEFGNEFFREMRFAEVKLYRRDDFR